MAVSGGVDSAVLLFLALKYAKNVNACFVKTEFQPEFELDDAERVCRDLNVKPVVLEISVLKNLNVYSNPMNRCYYCKKEIFSAIVDFASKKDSVVTEGTNASDDVDNRPGYKAIKEFGVFSPLRICGYNKSKIRQIARENNICVCEKPSYACLATRIPAGTIITPELLVKTEAAEKELFTLGYNDFRIRCNGAGALLELTKADRQRYLENKSYVDNILKTYYNEITLGEKVR